MDRDVTRNCEYKTGNSRIHIGRFAYGIENASILEWGEGSALIIGSFCSLANGIRFVLGGNHRSDWATTFPFGHVFTAELGGQGIKGHPATNGDIVIGHDVWIGSGASIMSGISIGDGAIIAANAHVVKNVGAYEIWGGNPARKLRDRFDPEIRERLTRLRWWELPQAEIATLAPQLSTAPTAEALDALILRHANMPRPTPDLQILPECPVRKKPFWKRLLSRKS